MGSREHREPDRVDVLLERRGDDLARRLAQAEVDDLEAAVAQRPRDDLGAAVVPVETGLRDQDAKRAPVRVGLAQGSTAYLRGVPHDARAWLEP